MNTKLDKILAEISAGELFDKITILKIKKTKIKDKEKVSNVEKELLSLNKTLEEHGLNKINEELKNLVQKLTNINLDLWEIEDGKREFEKKGEFGDDFISLARAVYKKNDIRAKTKLKINELLGSNIKEVKSYKN